MASGIDHVVIAVADPDAAATELTEKVGLAFTAGGRHAGLGTFNRIAFLGDAYLELMGVDDPVAAGRWAIGAAAVRVLERGGGFATYGLVDDAVRTTVRRLQANGSAIGPVVHGSRELPDGERVEWWTASLPELGPDQPPFLIRHAAWGSEWGADAMAARRAFLHPAGTRASLLGLELAVPDPLWLAAECSLQVGPEFQAIGRAAIATTGGQIIRFVPALAGTDPAARMTLRIGSGPTRSLSAVGVEFVLAP
jgi:catechol 2,3-dioxygenase-like lactoylglutathione lyase family enzyme